MGSRGRGESVAIFIAAVAAAFVLLTYHAWATAYFLLEYL